MPIMFVHQIFLITRAVLKAGNYRSDIPSFTWGVFGQVTCVDQSRESNIILWVINLNM